MGQECQKQPVTKTASFCLGKTKSGEPKSLKFRHRTALHNVKCVDLGESSADPGANGNSTKQVSNGKVDFRG